MALQDDITSDWPGLGEEDDAAGDGGSYADRTEMKRVADEISELVKKLTVTSGVPVTDELRAPDDHSPPNVPILPEGAGTLPDLQRYGALSEAQLGQWITALQFAMSVSSAYGVLIGETGSSGGLYASLVSQAQAAVDAVFDMTKTSKDADSANEDVASGRTV
ncbi:hypothetical protein [Nonomuraea pusilla]|uniref:Uncharacterized protein n=1 Tax=Nonomuraea pusilla TaxID=46177 RepID=A0A1H7V7U2_9ACTN|nr:hypothetical protein [Nonomuraea pusilla]SEM05311.1 hypothetical protein SAMN05660976_04031 [Nonomuraea pusilla]